MLAPCSSGVRLCSLMDAYCSCCCYASNHGEMHFRHPPLRDIQNPLSSIHQVYCDCDETRMTEGLSFHYPPWCVRLLRVANSAWRLGAGILDLTTTRKIGSPVCLPEISPVFFGLRCGWDADFVSTCLARLTMGHQDLGKEQL